MTLLDFLTNAATTLQSAAPPVDPSLALMLSITLGVIFAQASIHKLRDRHRFREVLLAYRIPVGPFESLRAPLTTVLAATLPAIEMLLAVYLIASRSGVAGSIALALLAIYTAAIALNLARGRTDFDCGCGGPAMRQPIGPGLVFRNGLLMSMAWLVALPSSSREFVWLDAVPILLGALGTVILIAGLDTAIRNGVQQRSIFGETELAGRKP
jgi:hypothetical protein